MRTLGFLLIALVSIFASTIHGSYTVLTFVGLFVGLVGATVCTVRGFRSLS